MSGPNRTAALRPVRLLPVLLMPVALPAMLRRHQPPGRPCLRRVPASRRRRSAPEKLKSALASWTSDAGLKGRGSSDPLPHDQAQDRAPATP
ncbi:hypothetical protein FMEAI12_4570006 [Parafrankia sp. Ea1.12]|nr:hypothetical protein FMEAI12_4570006 [Parafrankia sp. Ea1.12]